MLFDYECFLRLLNSINMNKRVKEDCNARRIKNVFFIERERKKEGKKKELMKTINKKEAEEIYSNDRISPLIL